MGFSPRVIAEGQIYELVSRARSSLPLPPNGTAMAVLKGAVARAQRDRVVTICNLLWMTNHCHTHAMTAQAAALPKFYGEYQKKITDALKGLLRRRSLQLWEDRTGVILLPELNDCIDRLIYMFSNPTKAGLVDRIDDYPGLNSWKAFTSCEPTLEAECRIEANWVPVAELPSITPVLTEKADKRAVLQMEAAEGKVRHTLILKPFAWLSRFRISDPAEIERIRVRIIEGVRANEEMYREARKKAKSSVLGAVKLKLTPFFAPHTPKANGRRIFVICSDTKVRISLLEGFRTIFNRCRWCYEQAKVGVRVEWPPGTFVPSFPPTRGYSLA